MDVRVLGPVQLLVNNRSLSIGGRKSRAILAALVVHRRRAVSSTALADAVWEGSPPITYGASLQVSISNLRKALRAEKISAERILQTVPPGYLLDITEEQCDVGRFEMARAAGDRAASPAAAAGLYRSALSEWKGEALADLRGLSFADEFATALDEERWQAASARIEADIACGKASAVIGELRSLISDQPLREPLWGQLITALYLSGRQADALEECRKLRAILSEQLGIDPSPELAQLERQVLRQETIGQRRERHAEKAGLMMTTTAAEPPAKMKRCRLHLSDSRVLDVPLAGIRIGRMSDNDLSLDDAKVSRYHAEIAPGRNGLVLRDLESTNGVFLNGLRVNHDEVLQDGVEIRIGSTIMRCEANPG
ncbi:FHA domain-containing protein [Nocardia sp. NBC_00565]|uniref:BTAD domain-containing putative transcriptional regulator n=1 Tax=Nocardia sp. NBC_00565 TaxID=2975993 RepID=UPI002E81314E|nr:BTAD domain-containing putative transcriptional regulator [Nocardia sp. NBC_00565]WUC07513.1 FHA domain-containing protein [Nocardia sp. NBC_00565]